MNIIELNLKKGKIEKYVIVISLNFEDLKNLEEDLDENVAAGKFHRGRLYIVREDNEDEFIQQLQEEDQ